MDIRTDNRQSKTGKAERSRENINLGQQPEPAESEPMERGAGQVSRPDKPMHPTDDGNARGKAKKQEYRNRRLRA